MKKLLIMIVAIIMSLGIVTGCGSNEEFTDDGGEELTLAQQMQTKTFKFNDSEAYIHIYGNRTYAMAGKDLQADKKILFWHYLEGSDDTIVLNNEFGGEEMTLTAKGDSDDLMVMSNKGDSFSIVEVPFNGIYKCSVNEQFLEGDQLTLAAEMYTWLSDYEVQNLKVGDVINVTDYEFMGTEVEKIDKQSDTYYRINDEFDLTFDEDSNAWMLADGAENFEQIGVCTIDENTKFTMNSEGNYKTLEECLANVDSIKAGVEVKGGKAVSIDVIVVE